jgi:hypothetical protein
MFSFLTNALLVALLTGNLGGTSWCPHDIDPSEQIHQLFNVSENIRRIDDPTWERPWRIDLPTHLTPVRTHGGIGP